jgi:biopolymer transport protein ExbD
MEEISLASIPDIVFLLMIFFVTSTVFGQEQGLPIVLPASRPGPPARVGPASVCTLEVGRDDRVTLDGEPLPVNAVKSQLVLRLRLHPDLIVVLSTHPQAGYGTMVAVFDEIRLAQARKVSLKTAAP